MKKFIFIIIFFVSCCAAFFYLYPPGEQGDWDRLQSQLKSFPDREDWEHTFEQLVAIEHFSQKYPKSVYLTKIIDEYLIPNLWIDVKHNGVHSKEGSRYIRTMVWEIYQPNFEDSQKLAVMIESELAKVPKSGWIIKNFGEEIQDNAMQKRGLALHHKEADDELLLIRQGTRNRLLDSNEHGSASPAFLKLLINMVDHNDALEIVMQGKEPEKNIFSIISDSIATKLADDGGVYAITKNYLSKEAQIKGKLLVELSHNIEKLPVTVSIIPITSTITEKQLKRQYDVNLQRWEYKQTEVSRMIETNSNDETTTYPVLKATITLFTGNNEQLWQGEVSSAWSWNWFQGRRIASEITQGSEVANDSMSYSAENLGYQIVYALLGNVLDFKNFSNENLP